MKISDLQGCRKNTDKVRNRYGKLAKLKITNQLLLFDCSFCPHLITERPTNASEKSANPASTKNDEKN